MNRFVCVHGHFYQPPRENPWLEAIEQQDSARPHHDWNHRITAECYGPNAHARILDDEGWIVNIANNYAAMSFNMGPTLLSWMADHAPATYAALLDADHKSAERFSGHGSALAQVYNHMIMPLANARDKKTQVHWGVRDFETRFGRKPEGMWLAETAADNHSLRALAEAGIKFTILAPGQCRRVRSLAGEKPGPWQDTGVDVDTTRPYWVELGDGLRIAVFFYNGPVSQSVAFERILDHGDAFAERLITGVPADPPRPTLVHIATDGESYGHHHRHGEMGLAYALHHLERNGLARLTNYAEFLALCPPTDEAEIVQPSSWSCFHGVERWQSDCGCKADPGRGWNQAWRRSLRNALDWLRDRLATVYEEHSAFADCWAARDAYIDVVLDRSDESLRWFLEGQGQEGLTDGPLIEQLQLLEMQRHAMLMYTSCGWFFDELSGIETVQIIQYAGRAIQLALPYDPDIEHGFLQRLAEAKSNLGEVGDGADIYARAVKPAMVDLAKVVAHYAVSSLFEEYGDRAAVYGFEVTRRDVVTRSAGRRTLTIGQVDCRAQATRAQATLSYAVLHLGDHNLSGGVRAFQGEDEYQKMRADVDDAFASGDLPALLRLLDGYFLEMTYSLKSLFGDEQRRVLGTVLDRALEEATQMSLRMHNHHASLIRYVAATGVPLPATVHSAAEFIVRANLKKALSEDVPDVRRVRTLVNEAEQLRLVVSADDLRETVNSTLQTVAEHFLDDPENDQRLDELEQVLDLLEVLPFEVDRFALQAAVFRVAKTRRPGAVEAAAGGDATTAAWLDRLAQVADRVKVRVG